MMKIIEKINDMDTGSTTKQIVDALLQRFLPLARRRIQTFQAQNGQYLTPSDPAYEHVLDSLAMVARHTPVPLLEALLLWRESESPKDADDGLTLQKKLSVECIFSSACIRFVECSPQEGISEKQWSGLENFVFYWLINVDRVISQVEYPSLVNLRGLLLDHVAQLLGALSRIRFNSVTDRFFIELNVRNVDSDIARSETLSIINGMHCLKLEVKTEGGLNASASFLSKINPLNRPARRKRSELHHALCNMLSGILAPLADGGKNIWPPLGINTALTLWYEAVGQIRLQLMNWMGKQSKHISVGFPLVTLLLCLGDPLTFINNLALHMEYLCKQLKDKSHRSMVLDCLHRTMRFYSSMYADQPRNHVWDCLDNVTSHLLNSFKRGLLAQDIQHDKLVDICITVANSNLDFAMSHLLLQLLKPDGSNEAKVIGLQAMLAIVISSNKRGLKIFNDHGIGHHISTVSCAVDSILRYCNKSFSHALLTSSKTTIDNISKEKSQRLLFISVLKCIPFLIEEGCQNDKITEIIPQHAISTDPEVREEAVQAMNRIMRYLPQRRCAVMRGMVNFILKLPDEFPLLIQISLGRLVELMHCWRAFLIDEMPISHDQITNMLDQKFPFSQSGDEYEFCASEMDSLGLIFLSSVEVHTRHAAFELLHCVRLLKNDLIEFSRKDSFIDKLKFEDDPILIIDVLEENGDDIVQGCYRDTEQLYFLRPEFDTVHLDVTIQSIVESPHKITWAKCLGELVRYSGDLCADSVREARVEAVKRLAHITPLELGGKAHQFNDVDSKVEQWLMYAILVCSCPPDNNKDGYISTAKESFQLISPSLKHGSEALAHAASVALGHTHLELSEVMFGELASFVEEVSSDVEGKTKSKNQKFRHEELHVHIADIHRAVAEKIWPGMLSQKPMLCSHFLKFIDETCRQLSYSPSGSFQYVQPLRFALASVIRHLAPEFVKSKHVKFDTRTRKRLFDLLLTWCDESGSTTENNMGYRREFDQYKFSQHNRSRESMDKRFSDRDMVEQVETIQWASMYAIASLLYGPCFDVNAKKLSGRVISWINRLFMDVATKDSPTDSLAPNFLKNIGIKRASAGHDKHNDSNHLRVHIAKSALKNLLQTNLDLFSACIDQCYSPESSISDGYFTVLSEIYLRHEIPNCQIHKILSLILYKIVDPSRQIRDYALKLLETLSYREWTGDGTEGAHYQASVVGNLPDSCQQFQYTLSAELAKDHPELSELLCEELMQRQLDAVDIIAQHKVLTCMAPWIGNLNFLKLKESGWSERLFKSLYYVTWKHGDQFPDELEKLWSTIGSNNRNIIPLLDFLTAKGIEECVPHTSTTYFAVAKRISLYLARICPQQTIDHLVCKLSQRILEDVEEPTVSNRGDRFANCVLQFSQGSTAAEIATDLDDQPRVPSLIARLSFDAPRRNSSGNVSWGTSALPRHSISGPLSTITSRSGQLLPALTNLSGPLLGANTSGNLCSHHVSSNSGDTLNSSGGSVVSPSQQQLALVQGHNQNQLSRADIALCLLAEIAYENDEEFREHLPLLFHIICISMDSSEDIVLEHCQHLLVNLLYSLAGRHLELHGEESGEGENKQKVASLIKYIQSKRGTVMWENEDPTLSKPVPSSASLLSALVLSIVDAIFVQGDLRETWGAEALKWAMECTSRHLACRSHQVYRTLKSRVKSDTCFLLLRCIHKCLGNPVPEIQGFAMEILMTLQVIVENMEPEKVILYPQLFWGCVALMHTDCIHIYCQVLELFSKIVDRLSFRLLAVENVLLSSMPRYEEFESNNGRVPAFEGVQPLVLKGLTSAVSHGYAIEVLSCIAIPFCDSVFGCRETRLLMHITGFLPWLGLQLPNGPAVTKACSVASKISSWCQTKSLGDLAQVFESYSRGEIMKADDLFARASPLICAEWFPKHSCLAFGHLLKLLERGPTYYQQVILLLLKVLLQQTPVDAAQCLHVLAIVSRFMEGPLCSEALNILETLLQSCSRRSGSHLDESLALAAVSNGSGLVENTPLQYISGGALTAGGSGGVSDGGLSESETSLRNTQLMLGCVIDNCGLGRKQGYKHLVPFVGNIRNE